MDILLFTYYLLGQIFGAFYFVESRNSYSARS